jgi:hypothetical protein
MVWLGRVNSTDTLGKSVRPSLGNSTGKLPENHAQKWPLNFRPENQHFQQPGIYIFQATGERLLFQAARGATRLNLEKIPDKF